MITRVHVTGNSVAEIQPIADQVDARGLTRTQITNHPVPGFVWFTVTELTDKSREGLLQWVKNSGLPHTTEHSEYPN